MKHTFNKYTILVILIFLILSSKTYTKNSIRSRSQDTNNILHTQWIKYYKYKNINQNLNSNFFFINNFFKEQFKYFPRANLKAKSNDALNNNLKTFITSETDFYLTVFEHNLIFHSTRQSIEEKIVDVLPFYCIDPLQEDSKSTKDTIDHYNQNINNAINYCIKIISNNNTYIWVICSDSIEENEKLFKILRQLKIEEQRNRGVYNIKDQDSDLDNKKQESIDTYLNNNNYNSGIRDVRDGYWIIIQQWTKCNLKCGGGEETLQRMCVPPKSGGKPCEGESILKRPCNTQPCQQVISTQNTINSYSTSGPVTLAPIIKAISFYNNKPQRYSKCNIKVSDMLYENSSIGNAINQYLIETNSARMNKIEIPVRVIMNSKTISIYAGYDHTTLIVAMNLENTLFYKNRGSMDPFLKKCFSLVSRIQDVKATLCPYINGSKNSVEEWEYDFNLFKHQCQEPKDRIELEKSWNDKLQNKIKIARREIFYDVGGLNLI